MEDRMESLTQKRSQVRVLFRPHLKPLNRYAERFFVLLINCETNQSGKHSFKRLRIYRRITPKKNESAFNGSIRWLIQTL